MSLPKSVPFKDGNLVGTLFTFDDGDVLPMHEHDASTVHVSFVISGEVEIYGPERVWSGIYGPGTVLSFSAHQWHEFAATKPGTKVLNLNK